jgi:hypothetical protein
MSHGKVINITHDLKSSLIETARHMIALNLLTRQYPIAFAAHLSQMIILLFSTNALLCCVRAMVC